MEIADDPRNRDGQGISTDMDKDTSQSEFASTGSSVQETRARLERVAERAVQKHDDVNDINVATVHGQLRIEIFASKVPPEVIKALRKLRTYPLSIKGSARFEILNTNTGKNTSQSGFAGTDLSREEARARLESVAERAVQENDDVYDVNVATVDGRLQVEIFASKVPQEMIKALRILRTYPLSIKGSSRFKILNR